MWERLEREYTRANWSNPVWHALRLYSGESFSWPFTQPDEMQKKKHSLKARHQYPWLHSFFGTAFMDNFDGAASLKVRGHASRYTNEKGNCELLGRHGLDEQSLAILSWGKVVGWNVTAEQLKLGKEIPRDSYTRNSRLETVCRRCGIWSVLEMRGMNKWSNALFLPQGYHPNSSCNASPRWEELTLLCWCHFTNCSAVIPGKKQTVRWTHLLYLLLFALRPKLTSCSLSFLKVARDGGIRDYTEPDIWWHTAI